jgi:hypothetical protein
MAKQEINLGSAPNAGDGDPLRTAFNKINENFTELYNSTGGLDLSSITESIIPSVDNTYNLGSPSKRWQHGYFAAGSLYVGDIKLSNNAGQLVVQQVTNVGLVNEAPVPDTPGVVTTDRIINGANTFSITAAGELELNGDPFTGGGGGLSISDFGLGFTDTLDAGKITTSKLYNENPNQGLNNQYTLEVTDGGVVALPDGSIINGATLKTIAGNYAGITAGPASPAGRDEDSWVWVDNDGATIATKYSTDNHTWTFNNNGGLTFPQGTFLGYSDPGGFIIDGAVDKDIAIYTYNGADAHGWTFGTDGDLTLPAGGDILDSNGDSVLGGGGNANTGNFTFEADTITNGSGLILETDRGTLAIGTNMETPGVAGHFHIGFNGSNSEANANDLFLGDDYNYVKLPGSELDPANQYGVEISANDRDGGDYHVWRFETDGSIRFPDNTVQTTAYTGQTNSSGELYIMANVDGDIVTSTNGIDWTAPQASGMNGIQRVEIHNGVIVYIPGGEEAAVRGLYYSTEIGTVTLCAGTNISTETDEDLFWEQVHYFAGSDKWVAVGYNDGDTNKFPVLAHSDNGITWTVVFVDNTFVAGFNTDDYDWRLTDVVWLDETNQYVITSFLDGPGATGGIFITEDITVALDGTTHVAIDFNARSVVPWSVVGFGGPSGYVILMPSVGGANDILSGFGTDPENYIDSFGLWEEYFIDELGYAPTLTEVAYKNGDFIGVTADGQVATIEFIGEPSLVISIPLPYTNTVFSISNTNPAVITWGMGNSNEANNEKIVVTLAGEYNGTYYVDSNTEVLYTDLAMTTALDASGFAAFTSGTVTFSHGQYFDAAGASNSYYYIGNDDEQVFRSSNGITWTQLADFTGDYFNDFAYGSFGTTSGADSVSYEPDDTDNWEDPTINTVQAALDELAARVTALQNFEIDGGNAYTPALGELLIDGNGA